MCIPQNIVIAIFGRRCTGKSTVAKIMAERHGLPVRLCGDLVRQAAADLNLDISQLDIGHHRQIDTETIAWVNGAKDCCIVEGRYLDQVLSSASPAVYLVNFKALVETRAARLRGRTGDTYTVADVEKLDVADDAFRDRMYMGCKIRRSDLTIDTTFLTPKEIANCLTQKTSGPKIGRD